MKSLTKRITTALALFTIGFLFQAMSASETHSPSTKSGPSASIVLGGGCFWCVEALYETIDGVKAVQSGYAGGKSADPSYQDVSAGTTGHAEVVKVDYEPAKVSLEELLTFFWEAHDPTTLNRQGADVGTQYRSVILYADAEQKAAAKASMEAAQKRFAQPIVTQIEPLEAFYKAESYHQDYFKNNPEAPYCRYVIAPKLKKLES